MMCCEIRWPFSQKAMSVQSFDIPFYGLYGKQPCEVDPLYVHVERVRDRSALHHGRVRAHRHAHLHQISLWLGGEGRYLLEDAWLSIPETALTLIPAGTVHGFEIGPGCDSIVISISGDFLDDCLAGKDTGLRNAFRIPRLQALDLGSFGRLRGYFEDVEREYRYSPPLQSDSIGAYIRLIVITAARLCHGDIRPLPAGPRALLLTRFQALLDMHFRERWTVAQYVEALGTTPYLLNTATRTGLGLEVSRAIRARMMTEAKRLLFYTMLNITEIATTLGYDDSAHFSRMFRQETGIAPAEWRSTHLEVRRQNVSRFE